MAHHDTIEIGSQSLQRIFVVCQLLGIVQDQDLPQTDPKTSVNTRK